MGRQRRIFFRRDNKNGISDGLFLKLIGVVTKNEIDGRGKTVDFLEVKNILGIGQR